MTDQYRNEDLAAHVSQGRKNASRNVTDNLHSSDAVAARIRQVMVQLHDSCATAEARDSLMNFMTQYGKATGTPDLLPGSKFTSSLQRKSLVSKKTKIENVNPGVNDVVGNMLEGRRAGLMDRLLSKAKRKSLVLI